MEAEQMRAVSCPAGTEDAQVTATKLHPNPLTGLVVAIGICVAAFLTTNFFVLALLVLVGVGMGIVGGIPKITLKLLGGLAGISVFLFALQVAFIREGNFVWGPITDVGLTTAGLVVLRLMAATIPLALVLELTPMNDLANALVKRAHLPYKYAFTITTALKFIPVFTDEMSAIMEAQTARGIEFDTRNPLRKVQLMLPLCLPLLVTSVGRIGQAALAAETRGFYLRTRASGVKEYPFGIVDAAAFAGTVVLIVIAVVL